jgi:hypothetical protein
MTLTNITLKRPDPIFSQSFRSQHGSRPDNHLTLAPPPATRTYRRRMERDLGEGAAADGGKGDASVVDGGPGQGATRDGGPGESAAWDGGPGGTEAVAGRGTGAAAYLGIASDSDRNFEGAAARVGTDSGMYDDMAAG